MRVDERIRSRLLDSDGDWSAYLRYWLRWGRSLVLPLFYRGEQRSCPCCGGRFARLADFRHSGWSMENVSCPRCGSLQRHRLLWLFMERETDLFARPIRILQIAPDWGSYRRLSTMSNVDYVTGDLQRSPMISQTMDIVAMPFGDAEFDLVICSHVLEHVPDDRQALAEMRRVLRPDGMALLQHPITDAGRTDEDPSVTDPDERLRRWGQADHVRSYGQDYVQRLRDAGFAVDFRAYEDELPEDVVERCRLRNDSTVRSQDIAVCRVP